MSTTPRGLEALIPTQPTGQAPHCPSCTCGRRAPLQRSDRATPPKPAGTISWEEHLEGAAAYALRWRGQDAETLARRGGLGWDEFVTLTGHEPTTWRPR